MFLIVGLGNPGKEYEETRHNLGFKVIAELSRRFSLSNFKDKHQSLVGEVQLAGHKIILAQPQTYMNNSGLAVSAIMAWHKIAPSQLILIYDDADLEVGTIRIREKGSAGGHHGIESIIDCIGTTEFARVRIGLGREDLTSDITNFVLQKIPSHQRELFSESVITAAEAVEEIVRCGIATAMNKFNC
jgi:PTH1 family peptidyl-tRNA hydrolase